MQRALGPVERIISAASMPVQLLLDPPAAAVQRVAGEADDLEGVHDGDRIEQFLGGGCLNWQPCLEQ